MSRLNVEKAKEVRKGLSNFFDKMCSHTCDDALVRELMSHRGYYSDKMFNTLKSIGVFKANSFADVDIFGGSPSKEQLSDWGLLAPSGEFLLGGRYVVAIRDIAGDVISLVGWSEFGGPRKYVTATTYGFARNASFFNADSYRLAWEQFDGMTCLVEGIFDAIALKSLGLPVLGDMGLEMGKLKSLMLSRYNFVVAMHDEDNGGRSVDPMLNGASGKKKSLIWDIPVKNVFVRFPEGVKDPDDLVKFYDCYDEIVGCQTNSIIKRFISE